MHDLAHKEARILPEQVIGRDILERQACDGWGAKVMDRLAADLRTEFPESHGFSPANLRYMRAFAGAWPDPAERLW